MKWLPVTSAEQFERVKEQFDSIKATVKQLFFCYSKAGYRPFKDMFLAEFEENENQI